MVNHAEQIHRASRLITELGAERNIFRAVDHLRGLAVQIVLDPQCVKSSALQAALLTIVNAGSRTLLGGVRVVNPPHSPTLTPLGLGRTLAEAVRSLGAIVIDHPVGGMPVIGVGCHAPTVDSVRGVRVEVAGWTGAVVPMTNTPVLLAEDALPIAGVLGGALAVSEIFSAAIGLHPEACDRQIGLSLWDLDPTRDWRLGGQGPAVQALPSSIWTVGLGHLGQAYLWALSSLSYSTPDAVEIWLQDDGRIGPESMSTGLLVGADDLRCMKTRVAASRLEQVGFQTRIIERGLGPSFAGGDDVPTLVLGGVDSATSRLAIADVLRSGESSPAIIDAGLGAQPTDFDQIALHTSPFAERDVDRLRNADKRAQERTRRIAASNLFGEIAKASSLDACGTVRLADIAVGVPYVGAAAGAIVIGEVLRRLAGARALRALSIDLRNLGVGIPPALHDPQVHRIAFTESV